MIPDDNVNPSLPKSLPMGDFVFCPNCYPMLVHAPKYKVERLLENHYVADDAEMWDAEVWEGGRRLDNVVQIIIRDGIPGALIVENVVDADGSIAICQQCFGSPMNRLRYAPGVELRRGQ